MNPAKAPRGLIVAAFLVVLLVPASALGHGSERAHATSRSLEIEAAATGGQSASSSAGGDRVTASASRRRVSIARAQLGARRLARALYLDITEAFDYGTGVNRNCRRHSRYSVTCVGYIDTYSEDDVEEEEPLTCWFDVRTTGTRSGFRVRYVDGSVECEPLVE